MITRLKSNNRLLFFRAFFLLLILCSCSKKDYSKDYFLFFSIQRRDEKVVITDYRMDQIRQYSSQEQEIRSFTSSYSKKKKKYLTYVSNVQRIVFTKDSLFKGCINDKTPLLTTKTIKPIICGDPIKPSFFQYVKDTSLFLLGKNIRTHLFITKPFYYSNDTLFVGEKTFPYYCDETFHPVYVHAPFQPIIYETDNKDSDNLNTEIIISRIDKNSVPPKIAKDLLRLCKKNNNTDLLIF